MSDLFDLTGKVAVVTGGSRGMGREMVLAFAQHGADVVIASRKIDACEELADEVRQTTGRQALPVACHVGYWEQCDELCDTVYKEFGRCDVLVNNAGVMPSSWETSADGFELSFAVNYLGTAHWTWGLLPLLGGSSAPPRIVNVSSIAGQIARGDDGNHSKRAGDEPFHVRRAAAVQSAVPFGHIERIGGPVLTVDGNDVGMA